MTDSHCSSKQILSIHIYLVFVIMQVSLYSIRRMYVTVFNLHILSPRAMAAVWTAATVCLLIGMAPLAHTIQVTGKSRFTILPLTFFNMASAL